LTFLAKKRIFGSFLLFLSYKKSFKKKVAKKNPSFRTLFVHSANKIELLAFVRGPFVAGNTLPDLPSKFQQQQQQQLFLKLRGCELVGRLFCWRWLAKQKLFNFLEKCLKVSENMLKGRKNSAKAGRKVLKSR
jgi:hypothetical protein